MHSKYQNKGISKIRFSFWSFIQISFLALKSFHGSFNLGCVKSDVKDSQGTGVDTREHLRRVFSGKMCEHHRLPLHKSDKRTSVRKPINSIGCYTQNYFGKFNLLVSVWIWRLPVLVHHFALCLQVFLYFMHQESSLWMWVALHRSRAVG